MSRKTPPVVESIPEEHDEIVILTATYMDWESVGALIAALDETLDKAALKARMVIIDDGSPDFVDPNDFAALDLKAIVEIRVVTLLRNMGNQRAVAIGMGYVATALPGRLTVLMDSDFEDQPHYVPDLVARARENKSAIVFAERTRRSEAWTFKLFYALYQRLYKAFTGLPISIGNFSAIPPRLVKRVAGCFEISSHFPAGIMRARVPYTTLPSERGTRKFGKSKMNFVPLIIHGLSGLAVHADVVVVRILLSLMLFGLGLVGAIFAIILLRLTTDLFLPGWTTQIVTLITSILFQLFVGAVVMVFMVLAGRNHRMIIPIVDHPKFVMDTTVVYLEDTGRGDG